MRHRPSPVLACVKIPASPSHHTPYRIVRAIHSYQVPGFPFCSSAESWKIFHGLPVISQSDVPEFHLRPVRIPGLLPADSSHPGSLPGNHRSPGSTPGLTGAPQESQKFTGSTNCAPHFLQVGSSSICVPQVSQNLSPGSTGRLQVGQVRLNAVESGLSIERNLAFTCYKIRGESIGFPGILVRP